MARQKTHSLSKAARDDHRSRKSIIEHQKITHSRNSPIHSRFSHTGLSPCIAVALSVNYCTFRSFLENCRTSQFDFCTGLFSHAGSFLITTTVRGQHPRSNHQHPNASGGKVILNLDTFVRGSDRSRLNLSMDGYCEVRK